jgi:hypothetical protein
MIALLGACSANEDNGNFQANGGRGGSSGGAASQAGTTSATSGAGGVVSVNVTEPDSTVIEDPDTYTTSCEVEACVDGEACFDACSWGSCCVHACPGQVGTGTDTCCDRNGGSVPGATCSE